MSGPIPDGVPAAVSQRLSAELAGRWSRDEVVVAVWQAWTDLHGSVAEAALPEMVERLALHRLIGGVLNGRAAGTGRMGGGPAMITELAVERLTFCCRHCGREWSSDYDVAHVEEPDGDVFEYFALAGKPVPSPYPAGSVLCPGCGQPATAGRLIARREVPVPPGGPDRPRTRLADPQATLAARRQAPPLPPHARSAGSAEAVG